MNLIVAVDRNWAIGNNGELLARIKGDQQYFKNATLEKVVILGRETLNTFPNGNPLKQRTNIILSRDINYKIENALVVHSIKELLSCVEAYNPDDVFVIGGQSVYEQLLPYSDTAFITKIQDSFVADKYFPNLDILSDWELVSSSEEHIENTTVFTFNIYKKKYSSNKPSD
jgi:dihydrofolate reductase